eukprot:scaffold32660_cov19-Tisochrysis_lutea.AAC.2
MVVGGSSKHPGQNPTLKGGLQYGHTVLHLQETHLPAQNHTLVLGGLLEHPAPTHTQKGGKKPTSLHMRTLVWWEPLWGQHKAWLQFLMLDESVSPAAHQPDAQAVGQPPLATLVTLVGTAQVDAKLDLVV